MLPLPALARLSLGKDVPILQTGKAEAQPGEGRRPRLLSQEVAEVFRPRTGSSSPHLHQPTVYPEA